ncbi:hypothetical protein SAMN05444166_2412 [Singulisphaera sp. GP187]|uniref:hypothetical protein n=1 Tax=Singulisphaera sp. GP187 TaxID=1882752 RepID=UPI00092AED0D|nr:hypothetical protein [Singulisphaera sp. GP187]SIO09438.1 hypothetical protein SAMN05444166_2412 [Singulisphaera sp. GP187]
MTDSPTKRMSDWHVSDRLRLRAEILRLKNELAIVAKALTDEEASSSKLAKEKREAEARAINYFDMFGRVQDEFHAYRNRKKP